MSPRYQFTTISHLAAGARGEPGKRTFFLEVGQDERWVRAWLEKAALQALGETVDQLLAALEGKTFLPQGSASTSGHAETRQDEPAAEFQVGHLALGYNETTGHLVLVLHEPDAPEDGPPVLECAATLEQMRALSDQIKTTVIAGRPLCPLCGGSMDPAGHVCPRHNGHGTNPGRQG